MDEYVLERTPRVWLDNCLLKKLGIELMDSVDHFSEREDQRCSYQERSVGNSLSDGLDTCNCQEANQLSKKFVSIETLSP